MHSQMWLTMTPANDYLQIFDCNVSMTIPLDYTNIFKIMVISI